MMRRAVLRAATRRRRRNLSDALPSAAGDPLLAMLVSPNLAVAVPVAVLSIGAIGTTLIASYLALSGFCTDALCALAGRCTLNDARNGERARVRKTRCETRRDATRRDGDDGRGGW